MAYINDVITISAYHKYIDITELISLEERREIVASFPGPAQLSVAGKLAGPGNEAREIA